MNILALDLGQYMAAMGTGIGPMSRHFDGNRVERAAQTLVWLDELKFKCGRHGWDVVIYERPFVRGGHATRALWGLAGLIEAVFGGSAAIMDLTPGSIKKWATGHGGASKEPMQTAAMLFGYPDLNEHEADAVCLYFLARELCKVEK